MPPESTDTEPRESAYNLGRIIALSDGVFAIAITLLVLEMVPDIAESVKGDALVDELSDMWSDFVAYLLSFLVIGRFWDLHRTLFRYTHLVDSRVVWGNLAILLWITLIPASAALLGSHWDEPIALTLYAINLLLANATAWGFWRYVSSAGYLRREGSNALIGQYVDRYAGVSLVGFALAVLVAFLNPAISLILLFLNATLARLIANRVVAPLMSHKPDPMT